MSIAAHSQISGIAAPQERLNLLRVLLTVSGVLVISALIAAAAYNWLGKPVQIAASAFEKTQISRINTDGKVQLPAISPDGKYVAYVSGEYGHLAALGFDFTGGHGERDFLSHLAGDVAGEVFVEPVFDMKAARVFVNAQADAKHQNRQRRLSPGDVHIESP